MSLKPTDYPRPPQDTGRGIHWSAIPYHGKALSDIDFWLGELKAMGFTWVKLLDDGGGSSLELCKVLLENGIMPVVRLYRYQPNPGHIGGREDQTVGKLVEIGVRYFETNNEPNLAVEWKDGRIPPDWMKIVAENFIIDANIVTKHGGIILMPAMSPGSQFRKYLETFKEAGADEFFSSGKAAIAHHNYWGNHPLNYPYDEVNQKEHPGATVFEDSYCWLSWYALLEDFRKVFGYYVPVLETEGGLWPGQRDDNRYPETTPESMAEQLTFVAKFMQGDEKVVLPDGTELSVLKEPGTYYFCTGWWLIANELMGHTDTAWSSHAWYQLDKHLPVVDALKALGSHPRKEGVPEEEVEPEPQPEVEPTPTLQWDPRLDELGVKLVKGDVSKPRFALVEARWYDEQESQGRHHIFVEVIKDGKRALDQQVAFGWPDNCYVKGLSPTGKYAADFPMYAPIGTIGAGPYWVKVFTAESDKVEGLGLGTPETPHLAIHTSFSLKFQWVEAEGAPPPPKPEELAQTLWETAKASASPHGLIMPLNKEAPTFKVAQEQGLGFRLSPEVEFTFKDKKYLGQIFEQGYVIFEVPKWDEPIILPREEGSPHPWETL
ncbi:MAG TPA: hypothetical protein ENG33_10735 [Chloroflexi bacterium]|nr:hypothetical protein [Chloroflexota bacterium]